MKRIISIILILLVVYGILAPSVLEAKEPIVSAFADTDLGSDSDSDIVSRIARSNALPNGTKDSEVPNGYDYTGSIISFTTPAAFGVVINMDCSDTEFTRLHNALDSAIISGTVEKDETSYAISMTVTWDFSTVDAETPGNYTVVGRISVPEGATLLEGLENTVSILVQVITPVINVSPSAITLTSFDEPYRTDAVAFAVGTSQDKLADWFAEVIAGFTGYDADGNFSDLISGEWSFDAVNTVTPGVYYAWTSPDLGTEYTLAKDVSMPRQLCAVSIQTSGEPDINCCVSGRGFLHFPWILSAEQQEQLDEFAVWLRHDGGEWSRLNDGFCFTTQDFQLSQRVLKKGSNYELKVTYPGGQTGVLSFQYDGELTIVDYSGGDRDGGDVTGGGSGAGTQPVDLPPPKIPTDSHGENNPSGGNNMPDKENSSLGSNVPKGGSDSSAGEPQLIITDPQESNGIQNNGNNSSDDNLPNQNLVTDKPATGTHIPIKDSAVPVYTDVFFSNKVEGTSSEPKIYEVSKQEDIAKTVLNPIPKDNDIPQEKIPEYQKPEVLTEAYSPTQTVISGLRLRDLCKAEKNVVFGSGGLTVSIPSDLLLALNLSDSDTLSVMLKQPESNKIILAVEVSGKPVTDLMGTVLRVRYVPQSENADIIVQNEEGEQIKDASYDGQLLRFIVDTAGTYRLLEMSNSQGKQKEMSPLLPVSGVLILAVGGLTFFWRKRHG